jgi:hypothetical protein
MRLCYGSFNRIVIFSLGSASIKQISSEPVTSDDENHQNRLHNPCEKYNSFWNRLQWAERRRRCSKEAGCVLIGRNMTGVCTPVDIAAISTVEKEKENSDSHSRFVKLYVEIAGQKSSEPIKVLLKESITNSAVDSLRDSEEVAKELSKTMIVNYLNNRENVSTIIKVISDIAQSPLSIDYSVITIAGLIDTVNSYRGSLWYVKLTKDYYIHDLGNGRTETKSLLVYLLDWWIRDPGSRIYSIIPLLEWCLRLENEIRKPASNLAAYALPLSQVRIIYIG